MYIIIYLNGNQYKIKKNFKIKIEKLNLKKNKIFFCNAIYYLSNKKNFFLLEKIFLKKIFCIFRVLKHGFYKKVNIFKIKKRKNYKRYKNHRQSYTEVILEKIYLNFIKK